MSDIGSRSGKISAGIYACGEYRIERQPSDYWWILKEGKLISQHKTYNEAYHQARYVLK